MSAPRSCLPTEAWLEIFDLIGNKRDLKQCRLVRKSWKPLVETAMYKKVDLTDPRYIQFEAFYNHLVMRPELGRLVQSIFVFGTPSLEPRICDILRLTPNIKVVDGAWKGALLDAVLSKPEFSTFKLERIPYIGAFTRMYWKFLLQFKETLRTILFEFDASTRHDDLTLIGDSWDQFKHLRLLAITDQTCFKNVRELDHLLRKCNQIQELEVSVYHNAAYTQTNKAELEQWLASSVPRVETWRFYDVKALKQFIDMLATQTVHLKCKVDFIPRLGDPPYICLMSALKERQHDFTTFEFQLPLDRSVKENTISVLSLFSSRRIKEFDMDLCESVLEPMYAAMQCNLNVESCIISTDSMEVEEYPEQPIFASLQRLEIVNTEFEWDFMTQIAPTMLTHLKLDNCKFEDRLVLPSIRLASLVIHNEVLEGDDYDSEEDEGEEERFTNLLFDISTAKCPNQMHLAVPGKPLPRQDISGKPPLIRTRTITIECESLKHLSVKIANVRFDMEFDDDTNLIKSVDYGIQDSYRPALEYKIQMLKEKCQTMESRARVAEGRYTKSKEYLSASVIKAIEENGTHQ
ncbi:hypothetical protein MBANPS3_000523 [Mucor bainieri]